MSVLTWKCFHIELIICTYFSIPALYISKNPTHISVTSCLFPIHYANAHSMRLWGSSNSADLWQNPEEIKGAYNTSTLSRYPRLYKIILLFPLLGLVVMYNKMGEVKISIPSWHREWIKREKEIVNTAKVTQAACARSRTRPFFVLRLLTKSLQYPVTCANAKLIAGRDCVNCRCSVVATATNGSLSCTKRGREEKRTFISICNPFRGRKNDLSRVAKWLPVCVIERERETKKNGEKLDQRVVPLVCVSPLHNLPCVGTNYHVIPQKTD